MRSENEITVQLRYWEGKLEGLEEGMKALGVADKSKDKVSSVNAAGLAVQRATSGGWVDALRWVIKAEEVKDKSRPAAAKAE